MLPCSLLEYTIVVHFQWGMLEKYYTFCEKEKRYFANIKLLWKGKILHLPKICQVETGQGQSIDP